jgi:hypothetical protein
MLACLLVYIDEAFPFKGAESLALVIWGLSLLCLVSCHPAELAVGLFSLFSARQERGKRNDKARPDQNTPHCPEADVLDLVRIYFGTTLLAG